MGLGKIGTSLAQKTASWVKAAGKTSVLQTKPINIGTIKKLRYSHNLTCDTVSLSQSKLQEINKKADDILSKLRQNMSTEYIEKNFPETVERVNAGIIETANEMTYSNYKSLETFRKEAPEKFVLFGKEKGSALDLECMMIHYGDEAIQTAKKMTMEDIRKVFSDVDLLMQKKQDFTPCFEHYMNMLIMKRHNPKTYEYIMSENPYIVKVWGSTFERIPSTTMLKNITPEQIQAMSQEALPHMKHIGQYVECSDDFLRDSTAVRELSESLSKHKLSKDVIVYRGDKTVGMFDTVEIDKGLEKRIRELLQKNKIQAQNTKITKYTGRYNCGPTTNLYDFLSSKESLTLADAMQVVKYGDDAFLKEVINRIQQSKIIDTRFKSYSFDEGMASGWRAVHAGDNTTIVQKTTIKKGTQGGFHQGDNNQYEIIVNNTPKEMTFPKVTYKKETDTFELNTFVKSHKD